MGVAETVLLLLICLLFSGTFIGLHLSKRRLIKIAKMVEEAEANTRQFEEAVNKIGQRIAEAQERIERGE